MIERSQGTSLIVVYNGMFEGPSSPQVHTSYFVLAEVFKSHLSRVKMLCLRLKFAMSNLDHGFNSPFYRRRKQRKSKEGFARLFTLAKQAASLMEHLELRVEPSEKNVLPNDMIVGFSKLETLIIEGCSMNWDLSSFCNLKTLSLSRIAAHLRPSMVQLLCILSQTPFIETLRVAGIKDSSSQGDIPSIRNVALPIFLVHLGHIELSCDLRSSALFFDNVLFSTKASRIELEHTVLPPLATLHDSEYSIAFMKRLAMRVENHIEDSLVKLMLREKLLCCFGSSGGQEPTTSIEIDLRRHGEFLIALGNAFWQSLRVDQLTHLEIEDFKLNKNAWMMFGDLSLLEELLVRSNECPLLEVLSDRVGVAPGITRVHPSFVALKILVTFGWALHKPGSLPGETIATQMINCFRSRKSMGLHLESIALEESRKIDNQVLAEFRDVIAEVYVGSNDWESSVESESGKENGQSETDSGDGDECFEE